MGVNKIKTIIAHPSSPLCDGMKRRIERWKIHPTPPVYKCSSPELFEHLQQNGGDVVILYDSLPAPGNLPCYQQLLQQFPGIKIILLTENTDPQYYSTAAAHGVKGFVHHFTSGKDFKKVIPDVMNNRLSYCSIIQGYINEQNQLTAAQLQAGFSQLEANVHNHLLKKYRVKDSARELGISPDTVTKRRKTLRKKLKEANLFNELEKINRKKK